MFFFSALHSVFPFCPLFQFQFPQFRELLLSSPFPLSRSVTVLQAPSMEVESSESPVLISERYHILKSKFKSEGIRRLLTASSREDFDKAFEGFSDAEKDGLYHLFQNIVVESLPYNLERALEKICEVAQVGSFLSKVEHNIEEHSVDVLSEDSSYIGNLQEKITMVKKDEIAYLKNLLEKVEKNNNEMRSCLGELKKNQDLPSTLDAVEKLRRWNAEFENCMVTSHQYKI